MDEIIKHILTSPGAMVAAIVVLWFILYKLFTFFKLSDTGWKRLEYVWLLAGMLALVSIVKKNSKEFTAAEAGHLKQRVRNDFSRVKFLLKEEMACTKMTKSEWSPDNLDELQDDQYLFCTWARSYKAALDTTVDGLPKDTLETLSLRRINFKTDHTDRDVIDFLNSCARINNDILTLKQYDSQIRSTDWENFSSTGGLLLLILAFAIRLSIATRNVVTTKAASKKKKQEELTKPSNETVDEQSTGTEEK